MGLIVLENWISALQQVEATMRATVRDSLEQPLVQSQIEDMNVEQMDAGKDAENKEIDPPYAELTKQIKAVKGQPFSRVTLKDEGDFHASVKVRFSDDRFTLYADDPKTPALGKKYGYQIFGLTDENIGYLREEVYPYILQAVRTKLF